MSLQQTLLGRFASLESDVPAAGGVSNALEIGQVVDEDGAQLDGENLVENDLIEAAEEADVVEEGADDVEELVETSEALESFLSAAQAASKQGGWTTQEAAAYDMGINIVMGRLGGNSRDVMPSLESFGSSRERINATASVENRITDTLKKIWEAIKRAVNKVIAFVRKWYLKIADGATRLKKRAEAIRKKAENTNGTAKEKKIRIPLAGLHISKNAPSAEQLNKSLELVDGLIADMTKDRMSKDFNNMCDTIVESLNEGIDGDVDKAFKILISGTASSKAPNGFSPDSGVLSKFPGAPEDGKGQATQELPGGKKFAMVEVQANGLAADVKEISKLGRITAKVSLVDASDKKVEIDSSKEVQILEPSQVAALADKVADLAGTVVDYRKDFENYERKTKDTLSKVDKIAGKTGKGENEDETNRLAFVRAVANLVGGGIRNNGTSITAVINYGLGLGRNVLVYGNSSLNQYKAD